MSTKIRPNEVLEKVKQYVVGVYTKNGPNEMLGEVNQLISCRRVHKEPTQRGVREGKPVNTL